MSDLISIITPSYNSEAYLKDCIESVIHQTYKNWEMLIVDDASKDKSSLILKSYMLKDDRIKPVFLDCNIGAAAARNIAIQSSNGRYVAFLDSDAIWLPKKLDVQIKFMKINKLSFTFSNYDVISENGLTIISKIIVPKKINYNQYLKNTIIGCLTVMLDKEKFNSIEMPLLRSSHDMALWLNLLRDGKYAYGISECLAKYRIVKTSKTHNKLKAAYDVWLVYREFEGLSFFNSFYFFSCYALNAFIKRL